MTWVKLDDQMINHPKIEQVGVVGLGLHVAALCYSNHHLTDGFISERRLELLIDMGDVDLPRAPDAPHPALTWAGILVDAGIWEKVDGGYQIHDYLDYQPSRREVLKERGQRSTKRAAAGAQGGKQTASKEASKRAANVQQTCSKVVSKRAAPYPVSRIPYPRIPVPAPVPEDHPPDPPQAGGISPAALRAVNGSNRKRDVAAASAELTLEKRYLGRRA